MKKVIQQIILSALFSLSIVGHLCAQQTLVNTEWETISGNPGQFDFVTSIIDNTGNIVSVGNHKNGNSAQIFFNSIHSNSGNVAWTQTLPNLTSTDDFGTDIATDAQNNIYVCGAQHNGSNYDYAISKFTNAGTLIWQKTYNGTGSGDDVPTTIAVDNAGNVYVSGSSLGVNTEADFATLKFDSNGNSIWTKRYNFNNKYEGATDIAIDYQGNIFVCGASNTSLANSDFVIIKYSASNGSQLGIKRHNTPGNGIDVPSEMVLDEQGNVYITGTSDNLGNRDIKTVAYNSSLQQNIWSKYTDHAGKEDVGSGIALDQVGNLIVTGHSQKPSDGFDMIVEKREVLTGNLVWEKKRTALVDSEIAKGKKVKTDLENNIYVVGEIQQNGRTEFLTTSYKPSGEIRFEKMYAKEESLINRPAQVQIKDEEIFVTGVSESTNGHHIVTIKYATGQRDYEVAVDEYGNPTHIKNELIVWFDSSMVIKATVDNPKVEFGRLSKWVKPEIIDQMNLKTGIDWNRVKTYRMFHRLKTTDTLSITRLGDTIPIPTFWACFVLATPEGYSEQTLADSILKLQPDIYIAELNGVGTLSSLPDDDEFVAGKQASLVATSQFQNGSINMEPAWDITQEESLDFLPNIKVGVFDTGVNWAHEDFNTNGTGPGTFSNSVIKDGWDFETNSDISSNSNSDVYGHGTPVAGIIGAIKNNDRGIAGIAGGDAQLEKFGASLYDMRIMIDNGNLLSISEVATAITEGSINSNNDYGFALHIMNHSWESKSNDELLKEAVHTAYLNNSILSISSGNYSQCINTSSSCVMYPSSYNDDWVMKVGASDANGERLSNSNYGTNLDFVAPGFEELIKTTKNNSSEYQQFFWTSAAAPHVSGVAALMLSLHNTDNGYYNSLAPEDVEHILQGTAEKYNAYTDQTGHGKINAGLALQRIDLPEYEVRHFTHPVYIPSASTPIAVNTIIEVPDGYRNYELPPGDYLGDVYEITTTVQHNIGNSTILDAWVRNSSSQALPRFIPDKLVPWSGVELVSYNNTTATLKGYIYHIKLSFLTALPQFTTIDKWYPEGLGNFIDWAYSLHVKNEVLSVEDELNSNFSLYPNPTNDMLTIQLGETSNKPTSVEIHDLTGKIVYQNSFSNKLTHDVNVEHFSSGMYFCKVKIGETVTHEKFVKK